jgi:hypothetical protein
VFLQVLFPIPLSRPMREFAMYILSFLQKLEGCAGPTTMTDNKTDCVKLTFR